MSPVGEGLLEKLVVLRRPVRLRQVLQAAREAHLSLLPEWRCFKTAAWRCSMTNFT